jgi:hypothetical protein
MAETMNEAELTYSSASLAAHIRCSHSAACESAIRRDTISTPGESRCEMKCSK